MSPDSLDAPGPPGSKSRLRRPGAKPMSPTLAMIRDGKKFMWDGQLYDSREDAARAEETYRNDNFEVQRMEQEGKFLVYTRRVVKEVVVTAQ